MSATVASDDAPPRLSRWSGIIPAVRWLRDYKPAWFRADLVAGITLAAYLLPAGLGDASLANLPPEAGLYACLFGGLVFWLFCSSRHTAIMVTSAISLFTYHETIVLAKHHIDYKPFGLAFVNAFILAKVMLVAEELRIGTRQDGCRKHPEDWRRKSVWISDS